MDLAHGQYEGFSNPDFVHLFFGKMSKLDIWLINMPIITCGNSVASPESNKQHDHSN
jgi:hypothetical protein